MNRKDNLRIAPLLRVFSLVVALFLLVSLSACGNTPPENTDNTNSNHLIGSVTPYEPQPGVINLWDLRYSYGDDIYDFTDNLMYEMYDRWLPYKVTLPETKVDTRSMTREDVKALLFPGVDYRDLIEAFGRPSFFPEHHLGTYRLAGNDKMTVQFVPRSDGNGNLTDVEILRLYFSMIGPDGNTINVEVVIDKPLPEEAFANVAYDYPFRVINEPISIQRYYDVKLPYDVNASELPVKISRDQWMSLTQGLTYKELRETYGKPSDFSVCLQYPMVNYRTTEGNSVSVYLQEVTENGKLTDILVKAIKIAFTDETGKIVESQTIFEKID